MKNFLRFMLISEGKMVQCDDSGECSYDLFLHRGTGKSRRYDYFKSIHAQT